MKIKGNWKKSNHSPVYERQDGFRIHTFGYIRKPCGDVVQPPYSQIAEFNRLVGGRAARTMMALCNHLFPLNQKDPQ